MSQVSIPNFPSNLLVPGAYFTVDASRANTAGTPKRVLLIGQMLTQTTTVNGQVVQLGGYTPNVPVIAGTTKNVRSMAGAGSVLARMYYTYRQFDPLSEVWLLPLLDDANAVAAVTQWASSGVATGPGVLSLYVAGQSVPVAVNTGDTAQTVLTNLVAALAQKVDLPIAVNGAVTASGTGGGYIVNITAKNGGLLGNDIDVRVNYYGQQNGEVYPPGLIFGFGSGALTGGAVNPTILSTALSNLSAQPYDYIACPYTDAASLNAIGSFLNDQSGRWSLTQEIFGHAFFAYRGTLAQRATFFGTRDDQHVSGIGFYDSPSPVWEWAASLTAAVATSINQDPALPVTGYVLPVLAPPQASQDTFSMRNTLLTDGCSTFIVNAANQVVLERVVTTYTTNPLTGVPDNSYQDVETLYTLMACIRDMRTYLLGQFQRKKLVADGSLIGGGSNMTTAQLVKQAVISRYRTQAEVYGWCQNVDQFTKQIVAQNAGGGVVRLLLPYQLANQLRIIAANVQFTKP